MLCSYGADCEDYHLLRFDTVQSGSKCITVSEKPAALKIGAAGPCMTSNFTASIPEDSNNQQLFPWICGIVCPLPGQFNHSYCYPFASVTWIVCFASSSWVFDLTIVSICRAFFSLPEIRDSNDCHLDSKSYVTEKQILSDSAFSTHISNYV